jgi:hypothetical protein
MMTVVRVERGVVEIENEGVRLRVEVHLLEGRPDP